MYKTFSYNLLGLLLIIVLVSSCEGRITTANALKDSITTFKSKNTIEFVSHTPKQYLEIENDTILSNGFRVYLKTFSNMDTYISESVIQDSVMYTTHHHEFETVITVDFDNKRVLDNRINKAFVDKYLSYPMDNKHMLKGVWVNAETSTFEDVVVIDFQYCKLNTQDCEFFNLKVFKDGTFTLLPLKDNML